MGGLRLDANRKDYKSDLIRRYTRRHTRRCSHSRYRPQFVLKPCLLIDHLQLY